QCYLPSASDRCIRDELRVPTCRQAWLPPIVSVALDQAALLPQFQLCRWLFSFHVDRLLSGIESEERAMRLPAQSDSTSADWSFYELQPPTKLVRRDYGRL